MKAEVPVQTVHGEGFGVCGFAFLGGQGFEGVEVDEGRGPAGRDQLGAHLDSLVGGLVGVGEGA